MGLGGRRGGASPGTEAVAPCEDTISALVELLVDPLLPAGLLSAPPSADQQATVGKQVQAVVLLYNYYHRKHNPELEFLDFKSFCKLAVVLKPSLLTYMKVMQRADYSELVDLEKETSLMEKMVTEACDLAKALQNVGTSEDVVAGWPISKVAVFLVDNRKENCLLLHSSSTLGVWSVIDKETSLGLSLGGGEKPGTKKKRITKKPQRENKSADKDGLQQHAFAAVKDAFGCRQSNLKVLETHTVYSLSKEKTAVRFYIVQCIESNIESNYLSIRDVIDSLRGPLLKKEACSWSTTSVVEYFHVLPYADVISNWFIRASDNKGASLNVPEQSDVGRKMDTCDRVAFLDVTEHDHRAEEPAMTLVYKKRNNSQKKCDLNESSGFKLSSTTKESYNLEDKEFDVSHLPNNMEVDELASDSTCSITVKSRSFSGKDHVVDEMNKRPSPTTDIVKKEVVDGLQSINEQNGENVSTEDKVVSSKYGVHDHDLVASGSSPKGFDKMHEIISSKGSLLSQTASKFLHRKRDMLYLQLHNNQNEIALCDKNIDTILRGGADALAVTLDTLIEVCNAASSEERAYHHIQKHNSSEYLKRKRPFEANLSVQNPCQELDQMCYKNSWPLPNYHVSTLEEGSCQSHVEVTGTDFNLSITGPVCATPHEAKESSATSILIKLHNIMDSTS